jgi:hypothetical protein
MRCERVLIEDPPLGSDDPPLDNEGWIYPGHAGFDDFLCPDCQTPDEDRRWTEDFLDTIARGQALASASGDSFPDELATTARQEAERIERVGVEEDALQRWLDGPPEPDGSPR